MARFVVVDGAAGAVHDRTPRIVCSRDGRRAAHVAVKNDRWFAVVGGEEGAAYGGIGNCDSLFSPNSKRVGYAVKQGDTWRVVVDSEAGPAYDEMDGGDSLFSADSAHVAYAAKKDNAWFVVLDGEPGPTYDEIVDGGPTFHDDGTLEYLATKDGVLYRVRHEPIKASESKR